MCGARNPCRAHYNRTQTNARERCADSWDGMFFNSFVRGARLSDSEIFMKKVLVTSALPYANGKVHLGHLAGAYLPADIFVRHLRLRGRDVKFICGSDEHGVPITLQALKRKSTPQQVVDEYHKLNGAAFAAADLQFDIWS